MLKGVIQDLRNAFDAHDRPAHEEAIRHLQKIECVLPEGGCSRGQACVCEKHTKEVCMYRLKKT